MAQGAESKAVVVPVGPPDRKNLERVIDKLQKKDPHKIFSKPVTEEEVGMLTPGSQYIPAHLHAVSPLQILRILSFGACRRQGTLQL